MVINSANNVRAVTKEDELVIKLAGIKEFDNGNGVKTQVAYFSVWKRQEDGNLTQLINIVNGTEMAWLLTSMPIQQKSNLLVH